MLNIGRSAFSRNKADVGKKAVIKVPSDIKYIRKSVERILNVLKKLGVRDDIIFDVRLSAEEAVRNAMVHGNRCDRRIPVVIAYWVEEGALHLEVEDQGPGFDPAKVPDPTHADNVTKNSGRGVYLIKRLMDRADYQGAGNRLVMVKSLGLR